MCAKGLTQQRSKGHSHTVGNLKQNRKEKKTKIENEISKEKWREKRETKDFRVVPSISDFILKLVSTL